MKTISLLDFPMTSKRSIYVRFKSSFNKFLIKELRKHFKSYKETAIYLNQKGEYYGFKTNSNRDLIYNWLKREILPLWVLKEICNKCKINKKEIDQKVVQYGLWSPNVIVKPKLPIKIDPIFISLIGNLLGDGCNSKKYSPLYYAQVRKESAKIFANKIEYVFGKMAGINSKRKFNIIKERFKGIKYEIKLPHIMGDILEKYAKTNQWYTRTSKIPEIIFNENKESKRAFLLSLIMDEGSVRDGNVQITSTNLNIIQGLKKITDDLNYKSKIHIGKNQKGKYYFLSITSISKLCKDLTKLISKYKILDCQKYKNLELSVYIKNNKVKQKNLKQKIFNILKTPKSVKEISRTLLIREDRTRYYLYKLKKQNKIKVYNKEKIFGGYQNIWIHS